MLSGQKFWVFGRTLPFPLLDGLTRTGHRAGILFQDRTERRKDRRPSILRSLQAPIPRPGGTRRAIPWKLPKCGRGERDRLLWICPWPGERVQIPFFFFRRGRGSKGRVTELEFSMTDAFFCTLFITKSKMNYFVRLKEHPDTWSLFFNIISNIFCTMLFLINFSENA